MAQAFLRTISRPGGKLQGRLFRRKGGEAGLSFFLREGRLTSDEVLPEFQAAQRLSSGDLPAVWPVDEEDFKAVNLTPRRVPTSGPFGEHHHETGCPDESQADILAFRVTKRGLLLPFVKNESA